MAVLLDSTETRSNDGRDAVQLAGQAESSAIFQHYDLKPFGLPDSVRISGHSASDVSDLSNASA